ncbi:MAG: phytoene/squalene synthase family protein [Terriglobales bacterium]
MHLTAAYAVCRSISRAAARNFYYSFLALPREKRDAMCAVYAFMRHADDISDEPGLTAGEKRTKLLDWVGHLRRVIGGESTDDPVLLAVSDARKRFDIPTELLEKLVAGTAMDVNQEAVQQEALCAVAGSSSMSSPRASGVGEGERVAGSDVPMAVHYESFADLYEYCYSVAAVVGLVCIRIFGYRDPSAEPLAEHCGIAFQLTNIIRDIKEDAALRRVYIPEEDLEAFGLSPAELLNDGLLSCDLVARFRPVLELEARRAREFYDAAEQLLPLIDEDSRPALWVLVTIYRRLLDKIAAKGFDVFGEKVRLGTFEKLRVLSRGLWMRLV